MSDDYARVINIVGLAFNLIGVLILFRWGMPFRVETHGAVSLGLATVDQRAIAVERIYSVCGWVGLVILILGTVLLIIAQLMPPMALPGSFQQMTDCAARGRGPALFVG
jgi:hypothetical protein